MSDVSDNGSASAGFDWARAHARLERARSRLEAEERWAPEEAKRILEARARELARPVAAPDDAPATIELLVCSLGEERYGIELAHVLDVALATDLTPVPCTPSFVLGAIGHRGCVLPVVDFRLVAMPATRPTRGTHVVVVFVEPPGIRFGIGADELSGVVRVPATELAPSGEGAALVRGVVDTFVSVLDLDALVRDPRFEVNDQPAEIGAERNKR